MNYSEEEKETIDKIETLCKYLDVWKENYTIVPKDKRYFKTLLNLIQKQESIIDKMAEDIEEHMSEEVYNFLYICDKCKSNNEECHGDYCTETIKEFYKKEVEKC